MSDNRISPVETNSNNAFNSKESFSAEFVLSLITEFNAMFNYNEFLKLFEEPNNHDLEQSRVIKELKKLLDNNSDFVISLPKGTHLYRARVISDEELNSPKSTLSVEKNDNNYHFTGFDYYNSKEPPLGKSPGQRNNYSGASYMYLAEDKYSACVETKPPFKQLISVAEFETKRDLRLFDFAEDHKVIESLSNDNNIFVHIPILITKLMSQFSVPVQDEKAYYPSQYVSDYIRKYGFDGVKYRSWCSTGFCYTIFNCCENNIGFVSSEIVLANACQYSLYDLNTSKRIDAPDGFDSYFKMDSESISEIKEKVYNQLKKQQKKRTDSTETAATD